MGTEGLTWFNELPSQDARGALLACCSVPAWADQMAAARPYGRAGDAIALSGAIVAELTVAELAEGLAGHPRIGERPDTEASRQEQAGVDPADAATRRALADANVQYEERFGHIYLVCASGRTGTELLALLHGRLRNEPEKEWQVVRAELQKINALRLERLLGGSP